jgi:hypothetical protein
MQRSATQKERGGLTGYRVIDDHDYGKNLSQTPTLRHRSLLETGTTEVVLQTTGFVILLRR